MERFPLPVSRWALPFLALFAPRGGEVRVHDEVVEARLGVMGSARVPIADIERISHMRWPWWGGVGVRIGRGLVAFAATSGRAVVLELARPVSVRAPLPWTTRRLVLVVDRPEHLAAAVAARRSLLGPGAPGDAGEGDQPSTG